jgi:outer membrane receptor protein involved in Fe transport
MSSNNAVRNGVRQALFVSALAAAVGYIPIAAAQEDDSVQIEEITVTGTRIKVPGVVSSSPIYSVGADEIQLQAQPEVERILRLLPITKPDDGQNVNNGTDGAATIDLRGLGEERNLILINGKRATPYSIEGLVDTQTIPTALVERIDIITGGASAVYGSDAIAGALNFVMKEDFEGVDFRAYHTETEQGDGKNETASLTLGANLDSGRGNVVMNLNWTDRDTVLFESRPLGQLGIDTSDGSNYAEFLAGQAPAPAPAGCGGPGAVAAGGSTTTVPTRVAIAGGPALGQFQEDGTLGADCSVFNFNPFNQYQTPQQRWGGMVLGNFEISDHVEAYSNFRYTATNIRQQIAPSGVFGSAFMTPLANPLMSDQARNFIISAAEAGRLAGTVCADVTCAGTNPDPVNSPSFINWVDVNGDGVVDAGDDLNIQYRRRTVEFGNRSSDYGSSQFQFLAGLRGAIVGDWDYDFSFQRGEADRTQISAGYTNVDAIKSAVRSFDGVTCEDQATNPGCVPINLFGGFGAITPAMAAANSATGIEQESYKQTIISASVSGPINGFQLPTADDPVAVSFGAEYREETGVTTPDECLKLQPEACLGGFGGSVLPVQGEFDVTEGFFEAYVPIVSGRTGFQSLALELGYRSSDYSHVGANDTWKAGVNWRPVDSLLFRAMVQQATRAPNVAEIGSPVVAGLEDALMDPCSIANAGNIDPTLNDLCISTGMTQAQVGAVEDIVSGQVDNISGSDPNNPPGSESADTFTAGIVWTPDFDKLSNLVLSLDYYDIDIQDVIGEFSAQEVLDGCYVSGLPEICAKVNRIGGSLTLPGSGTQAFTQNLDFARAEGLELSATFGVDLGAAGDLEISGTVNHYLTQESRAASFLPVTECVGRYGNTCGNPLPETRWIQRTAWFFKEDFMVSYLWRHLDSVDIEAPQVAGTFPAFRSIGSVDYFDLTGTWQATPQIGVNLSVYNVLGEEPPVVGNEAGTTSSNSGNTFPSFYDTLGTVFTAGFNLRF